MNEAAGMASARVIFVNRYFYPDLSATSQILTDLAMHLAGSGVDVTVVTGRRRYTDPKESLPASEDISGVRVLRVATTGFGRLRLLGRAVDYSSFYVAAFFRLLTFLKAGDIVIAKTDPPLVSVVTAIAARLKRARQVNWLQDLFPEVAVILRPDLFKPAITRIAQWARDWSLKCAELNVVLSEGMSHRLVNLGIKNSNIAIIPNWADDEAIAPVSHERNPLRTSWGLDGKFVVAYSGNLGRAHDVTTMLEAAQLLRNRSDIVFLIIGGGARLEHVQEFILRHTMTNIIERPYQARERLSYSLGAADLHLVSLIPALEGLIVPSKFYGIAAAQRPTAFIGNAAGEIGTLLRTHEAGRTFAVGDAQGLADFIVELSEDPQKCASLGRNARRALETHWAQTKAFERWRETLARLQNQPV